GIDRSIASSDPSFSLIGEIVRRMHHHRGRANRFELAGLTTHGCETGIDVGWAEGPPAKSAARCRTPAHRVADSPTQSVKKIRDPGSRNAFHHDVRRIAPLSIPGGETRVH